MSILVTGGAGYIGSHTVIQLIEAGHQVVIFDNFENSHYEVISRIKLITGKNPVVVNGDIREKLLVKKAIIENNCKAVIHFAGLKAVGESNSSPLRYYDYNVVGTVNLLEAMIETDIRKLIFSSSATVYGIPETLPLKEEHRLSATNPYGRTKLMIEEILTDLFHSDPSFMITILRYFNPVGAHTSGLIGEDPKGTPNNLMPIVAQVASGSREYLHIWGDDYQTKDGTGIRDYIHVEDLAAGHISALENLTAPQCQAINLGTGNGYSVLELISAFEHISNRKIKFKIAARRDGDVAINYACAKKAFDILGWKATKDLERICKDTWNWVAKNPNGYN